MGEAAPSSADVRAAGEQGDAGFAFEVVTMEEVRNGDVYKFASCIGERDNSGSRSGANKKKTRRVWKRSSPDGKAPTSLDVQCPWSFKVEVFFSGMRRLLLAPQSHCSACTDLAERSRIPITMDPDMRAWLEKAAKAGNSAIDLYVMGNNPELELYRNKPEAKECPIPRDPVTHERLNVLDGKTSYRWSFSHQGAPSPTQLLSLWYMPES